MSWRYSHGGYGGGNYSRYNNYSSYSRPQAGKLHKKYTNINLKKIVDMGANAKNKQCSGTFRIAGSSEMKTTRNQTGRYFRVSLFDDSLEKTGI